MEPFDKLDPQGKIAHLERKIEQNREAARQASDPAVAERLRRDNMGYQTMIVELRNLACATEGPS